MNRLFCLALTLGGAAVACSSSPSPDSESLEQEARVKPKGTENWGTLTLELPAGHCLPGEGCAHPLATKPALVTVPGIELRPGVPARMKPGHINYVVGSMSGYADVFPGKNTVVKLAVARRACIAASVPDGVMPEVSFGRILTDLDYARSVRTAYCPSVFLPPTIWDTKPDVSLYAAYTCPAPNRQATLTAATKASDCAALTASDSSWSAGLGTNGTCFNLRGTTGEPMWMTPRQACERYVAGDTSWINFSAPLGDGYQAYIPGRISASVQTSDVSTTPYFFDLAPGSVTELTLPLPLLGSRPETFRVDISFADTRELPDAAPSKIVSSCANESGFVLPAAGSPGAASPLSLSAFKSPSCSYALSTGGTSLPIAQTGATAITLHRIDVDDVEVTRENGTSYVVKGTWTLTRNGVRVGGSYATGLGIDVLPGTYDVKTSFSTADGPQTTTTTLTF